MSGALSMRILLILAVLLLLRRAGIGGDGLYRAKMSGL
jgi:hypothetical protein